MADARANLDPINPDSKLPEDPTKPSSGYNPGTEALVDDLQAIRRSLEGEQVKKRDGTKKGVTLDPTDDWSGSEGSDQEKMREIRKKRSSHKSSSSEDASFGGASDGPTDQDESEFRGLTYEIQGVNEVELPKLPSHSFIQKCGQELFLYMASMTPTIFFAQILPSLPAPHNGILEVAAPFANYLVTKGTMRLTTEPMQCGRRKIKSTLPLIFGSALSLSVVAALGEGLGELQAFALNPNATHSNFTDVNTTNYNGTSTFDEVAIIAKGILLVDAFRAPIFGTLGYAGGRLCLAMWNQVSCKTIEYDLLHQDAARIGIIQVMGGYVFRFGGAFFLKESILWTLRLSGNEQIANSPFIDVALAFGSDAYLQALYHLSFHIKPCKSLFAIEPLCGVRHHPEERLDFVNAMDSESESESESIARSPVVVKITGKYLLAATVGYMGSFLTCAIPITNFFLHFDAQNASHGFLPKNGTHVTNGPLCNQDDPASRLGIDGIGLGTALGINFLLNHAGDLANSAKALVRFGGSMFSKRSPFGSQGYEIVPNEDSQEEPGGNPLFKRTFS